MPMLAAWRVIWAAIFRAIVVVQNMPGAGSLTAVRYLEGSAARDGTAMTVFLPGIITQSIVAPEKIKLDMSKYTWIGVVSPDYFRVCYGFGPDGVSARVLDVTRNVVRLQSGYLYHYAFAMLIGAAAFITWFMFSGGVH